MDSGPVPYRVASSQQYTGAFPPSSFYRDTYGLETLQEQQEPQNEIKVREEKSPSSPQRQVRLQQLGDSTTTESSLEDPNTVSVTTKSTVRTVNFIQPNMEESVITNNGANITPMTQSFQVVTTEIVVLEPRSLLLLGLIELALAIQLLIFATICIFYDGCPYLAALFCSLVFLANGCLLLVFIKLQPVRSVLLVSLFSSTICLLLSMGLFAWTAYLIDGEDKNMRRQGWNYATNSLLHLNRIVTNTKIAMYSMHMILTPVYAICCAIVAFLLYRNFKAVREGQVTKAYFFSQPPMGHQKVLVPIELKQVRSINPKGEKTTTAVQTSGYGGVWT